MTMTALDLGWRWALIAGATGLAFWQTWSTVWRSVLDGGSIGYVLLIPILAAVMAFGVARRSRTGAVIQDRQTDIIVGSILLVIALSIEWMLVPRFAPYYFLLRIDILGAWSFVLAATILLFGLGAVSRFWPVAVFVLVTWPMLYRLMAVGLGGGSFAYGLVMVVISAVAVAYAIGRRGVSIAVLILCLAAGSVTIRIVLVLYADPRLFVLQLVATATCLSIGVIWFQLADRAAAPTSTATHHWPAVTSRPRRAAMLVVAAGVGFAVIPFPTGVTAEAPPGPPWTGEAGLVVPTGWNQLSVKEYTWAKRYFTHNPTFVRQTIRARRPNLAWDVLERNRTAQIDVLTVGKRTALDVTPARMTYDLSHSRISETVPVDIGRGITAEMFSVVDDNLLLTWTNLSFHWVRGPHRIQRVTLVTVDNHEPDAYFPEPVPSTPGRASEFVGVLLRGVAAASDTRSEFKDRDLLQTLARELVEVQSW